MALVGLGTVTVVSTVCWLRSQRAVTKLGVLGMYGVAGAYSLGVAL